MTQIHSSQFDEWLSHWVEGANTISRKDKLSLLDSQLYCVKKRYPNSELESRLTALRQKEQVMTQLWDPVTLKEIASTLGTTSDASVCESLLESNCCMHLALGGKRMILDESVSPSLPERLSAQNEYLISSSLPSTELENGTGGHSGVKVFLIPSTDELRPPQVGASFQCSLDKDQDSPQCTVWTTFHFTVGGTKVERIDRTIQLVSSYTEDQEHELFSHYSFRPL